MGARLMEKQDQIRRMDDNLKIEKEVYKVHNYFRTLLH